MKSKRSVRREQFAFRSERALIDQIDAFATTLGNVSRSDAFRILLRDGLVANAHRATATAA